MGPVPVFNSQPPLSGLSGYDAFDLRKVFLLLLCWLFRQTSFFAEFLPIRFVPNLGMSYSETRGIPRNKPFFPRNNENRSESIQRNFFRNGISINPTSASTPRTNDPTLTNVTCCCYQLISQHLLKFLFL